MKKTILLSLFVFISCCLKAQTSEDARKLLDEVSKTISGYKNLSFDFTYVLENRQENIRQENKGSATISGDFYKLNFLGNEQLFNGIKTYTIIPENEEITINDLEEGDEFGINPSKLLFFYKKGYAYQWDIKQSIFNRTIQFIKLIPIEESSDLKYILLGIDIQKKIIYRLIEITKSETITTLTLKNLRTNIKLDPNFFNFDISKYPDYYIND